MAVQGSHTSSGLQLHDSAFKQTQWQTLQKWCHLKQKFLSAHPENFYSVTCVQAVDQLLRVGELCQFLFCEQSQLLASTSLRHAQATDPEEGEDITLPESILVNVDPDIDA